MTHRLFTAKDANATLPLVRRIVADILKKGVRFRSFTDRPLGPDELDEADALRCEVVELIEELEALGCAYKDLDFKLGLVDFPGLVDGQPVSLCWRGDEDAVTWYHAPDAGFQGRKKIPGHEL